jgi:predicted nucleotidyltransferase
MKAVTDIKTVLEAQKPYLAKKYGVVGVAIFGYCAPGEQCPDNDIDILIELQDPPRVDLFDLVNLEYDLSDLLGVRVDLAIKKNLRKQIGRRILSEVVAV